jgi:hypothetical protein
MGISTEKAYEILALPLGMFFWFDFLFLFYYQKFYLFLGASKDAIEQSYKKLAYKWHPEKHTSTQHTQEALKVCKFLFGIFVRKLI